MKDRNSLVSDAMVVLCLVDLLSINHTKSFLTTISVITYPVQKSFPFSCITVAGGRSRSCLKVPIEPHGVNKTFSNLLIIHQVKTNEIITVTMVWKCDLNYPN